MASFWPFLLRRISFSHQPRCGLLLPLYHLEEGYLKEKYQSDETEEPKKKMTVAIVIAVIAVIVVTNRNRLQENLGICYVNRKYFPEMADSIASKQPPTSSTATAYLSSNLIIFLLREEICSTLEHQQHDLCSL